MEFLCERTYIDTCPACKGARYGFDELYYIRRCSQCGGKGWLGIQLIKAMKPHEETHDLSWLWEGCNIKPLQEW